MIHVDFKEMKFNFRCEFKDAYDRMHELLMYGESEQDLKNNLEEKGCHVLKINKYDVSDWKKKAEEETSKVIEAFKKGEPIEFKNRIWAEIKDCLFRSFNGKCAYCESKVRHVASGDVEHYRPKGKVEEDPNHPGYYWLAYDCSNLLPSCEKCNRSLAKMNHFPVEGQRAYRPEDIDKEKALLLHPYKDKPEKDLKFPPGKDGLFLGTVVGITKKGKESIKYYHLDRDELKESRREEQEEVERDLGYLINHDREKLKIIIEGISKGIRQYSAAAHSQFLAWKNQLWADLGE